ncbi:MAG: NAD(P)-dependent oxidoreductase, partial [Dongiaceae bacterium]
MARVAFIGLGVMGFPMAGHLSNNGHDVTVFNRTSARAEAWTQKYRGRQAATPAAAAKAAQIVFSCVGNDDDLRSVAFEPDGILAGMSAGSIFVDHTTASAEVARELSAAAARQKLTFLDAPLFLGHAGAVVGDRSLDEGANVVDQRVRTG